MEPSIFDRSTPSIILCCICGLELESQNSANMCIRCIRQQVDITEGIPKQIDIFWCKGCERYLDPPDKWIVAALESSQLLQHCVKKVRGLTKVKLTEASFIWTEPHSRRIKVKLTIQKEVMQSMILQQAFIIEYVVHNQFCNDCHKVEAKNTWTAVVQARQRVNHKRTFFWLEQIILKHKAHAKCTSIREYNDGLDFYFQQPNAALRFLDFLGTVIPMRWKSAKQLISTDVRSNLSVYKFTYFVEIPPICKDDLCCLPVKLARSGGDISPLVVCSKVSNVLSFIDPFSLQTMEISNHFWHNQFRALSDRNQLIEYIVIDIVPLGVNRGKLCLAEATVARSSDFGVTDKVYITKTHLGNVLNPGDTVAGYDYSTSNYNDSDIVALKGKSLQSDIILVKKLYPNRKKITKRNWTLGALAKESEIVRKNDLDRAQAQYEEFLREIEENPDMRAQIKLFKNKNSINIKSGNTTTEPTEEDEDDFPEVKSDELLDQDDDSGIHDEESSGEAINENNFVETNTGEDNNLEGESILVSNTNTDDK